MPQSKHILPFPSYIEKNLQNHDKHEEMRAAYTVVINKYAKNLFNFGIRFCQDKEVVKDCIQQLFLDLWDLDFDVNARDTIKAYIFKAMRNRVIREQAKWGKNLPLDEEHDFVLEFGIESKMIAEAADREMAEKVKRQLDALPARQREIIYLRFYEGLNMAEISAIMNINTQSAHNLLQKAYQKIRVNWQSVLFIIGLLYSSENVN